MCGRYNFTTEESEEIRRILERLDQRFANNNVKTGEIFPTNIVPVLVPESGQIEPIACGWGFPNFKNKGVIINARSETVFEKKTFRESLIYRRCVIPANGFYEWNKNKERIYFKQPKSSIIYMAGIYNYYNEESRFVILTTGANQSIVDIHDRMPLILYKEQLHSWLFDNEQTQAMLNQVPTILTRKSDYEQTKLDLI